MSNFISLQDGIDMTSTYRGTRNSLIEDGKVAADFLPLSETFDNGDIKKLMDQSGCQSVRVYFGEDGHGLLKLVLVGVDGNDNDILTTNTELILDRAIRCPTNCPASSVLNS